MSLYFMTEIFGKERFGHSQPNENLSPLKCALKGLNTNFYSVKFFGHK